MLVALLPFHVSAEDSTSHADFQALREGVKRFKLSNGLRVLYYRRAIAPVFTGQIWVRVGGVNEQTGSTGISHLLEHMAFKGTEKIGTKDFQKEKPLLERIEQILQVTDKKVPFTENPDYKKTLQELQKLWVDNEFSLIYKNAGAVGLNAATSKDYTYYTVALPKNAFELWCWMESERLLNPVFRQFYEEREVVLEERRSRVDDSPDGRLYELLLATAFPAHPNRLPVIGWESDVSQLTASETAEFYRTYYRPDNMVIGLVGDLDEEVVRTLLEKYFSRLPEVNTALPQIRTKILPQKGERQVAVEFDAEPTLFMSYHKPAFPDRDDAAFAVLHSVLSGGRSSVFHRELVLKKQIASSVYTTEAPGELFDSLFVVGATPKKGVSVQRLRDEIQAIIDRYQTTLISEDEVSAAKRQVQVGFLNGLNSNSGLAQTIAKTELLWNDWEALFRQYEQIHSTSAEDVKRLVQKYLRVPNRTFAYTYRPEEK